MHSVDNGGKSIQEKRTPKIAIGFQVGKLEVVSATAQRKNGYTVWNCRCECGKVIQLDTRCLRRGTVRKCGCDRRAKVGHSDISGQRFGKLVVLEETDQLIGRGNYVWRCRCDCGKETLVPRKQLIGGYTKSCGCLGRPPLKDWMGKRFGLLEVVGYDRKENGKHYWKCKCDCGNTVSVCQSNLKIRHTKSCGCLADLRNTVHFVEGTYIEAIRSKTIFKNNTSGVRGVYLNKKSGKWVAQISFKGKTYTLGSYLEIEDAAKARKEAEDHLFGEFLEWYDSQYPKQKRETGPI